MLAGYLGFLLLLFLPGFAAVLLLRQEEGSTVSTIVKAYVLSLVINSFVGFSVQFLGIEFSTLTLVDIAVSAVSSAILLGRRYTLRNVVNALRSLGQDKIVVAIGMLLAFLLLLQFLKYPIFPKSYSVDFIQHTQLIGSALSGQGNLNWSILYGGVHFNLAMGQVLVGGDLFTDTPVLMALLAAPSSLLVYEAALRLYGQRGKAILAQGLYVVTGFVWYVPLYDSGLYPNLYGTILSLGYIIALSGFYERKTSRSYALLVALGFGLYLSHYSVVLFVAAVDLYALATLVVKRQGLRSSIAVMLSNALPLGLGLLRPDLATVAQQILGSSSNLGAFPFTTPLADVFSFSPFLHFLVAEIYSYAAVILLVFTLPLALYYFWLRRKESPMLAVLVLWLGVIWLTTPSGDVAWRFSNQALMLLILSAPASFGLLITAASSRLKTRATRRRKRAGRRRPNDGITTSLAIAAVIMLIVFSGSWTNIMIGDLATNPQEYSSAQIDLYSSILWFNQSTPAGTSLLSVTDWRISFMQTLTGRYGSLLMLANSTQALAYARANHFGYVLVTFLIPASIPAGFDAEAYYNSFAHSSSLKAVYSNPTDVIYEVLS